MRQRAHARSLSHSESLPATIWTGSSRLSGHVQGNPQTARQFLSRVTAYALGGRNWDAQTVRAAVAPEENSPDVDAHSLPPDRQRSMLSLLGSIPGKVTVTVKNNVVSAKSLFSTARRIVRIPRAAAKAARKAQRQETARNSEWAALTTPTEAPLRRKPTLLSIPAVMPVLSDVAPDSWTELHHHGLHPSLRLVRDRYWAGSKPGKRQDGFKLGLVVEGGGMRGIVSGAMLMQLHQLGLRDVFDAVYGASAGAINASYFLAGQADSVDIYFRHINNPDFINLARIFTSQPVMNLDMLVEVMNSKRALNWDAVLNSPIPLKVVASCLDSLGPVLLEDFEDKEDLTACLRASANVPQIVGPPCQVRGRRLVDAAVFEPVPYRAALKDSCTHLVVLCSRPRCRSSPLKRQLQQTMVSMLKRTVLNPTYMREAWRRELQMLTHNGMHLDDLLALALEGGEQSDLYRLHGGFIFPVYPGTAAGFAPITTDTTTLERGLAEGASAAQSVFGPLVNLDTQLDEAINGVNAERLRC